MFIVYQLSLLLSRFEICIKLYKIIIIYQLFVLSIIQITKIITLPCSHFGYPDILKRQAFPLPVYWKYIFVFPCHG